MTDAKYTDEMLTVTVPEAIEMVDYGNEHR